MINELLGEDTSNSEAINEDLLILKNALTNERSAPELLVYENEVIIRIKDQLDQQQHNIDILSSSSNAQDYFVAILMQMEVDRVRYILKSYLRTRLKKISQFPMFIYSHSEIANRLSPNETNFIESYVNSIEYVLNESFLNSIPHSLRNLSENTDEVNMVEEPSLNKFVFLKIMEPIYDFPLSDSEDVRVNLAKGDIVCVRYNAFRQIIFAEKAKLL